MPLANFGKCFLLLIKWVAFRRIFRTFQDNAKFCNKHLPEDVVPHPEITADGPAYVLAGAQEVAATGREASLTFVIGEFNFNKAISLSCT